MKPPVIDEVPGSQPSLNTNSATRKVAEANSGTEVVRIERNEILRSSAEPSRMPASTPSSSDSGIMIANTHKARMPVLASRSQSRSLTGVLKRIESPKSPRSALPTHST